MKTSTTKRLLVIALAVLMLTATVIVYSTASSTTKFGLEMTASANASDSSIIDVVVKVKDIQEELDSVEFKLNFDKSLVAGVITEAGTAMDAFMTVKPMYTLSVSGTEVPVSRYEQICYYDAANGYYECRFVDLLDYASAKEGETYNGLINDGDLTVTIQFKITGGTTTNTQYIFSATDVYGTTRNGYELVSGTEASANYKAAAVVADPVVSGTNISLSLESEVLMNFYYTVSDVTNVTEHGLLIFNSDPGTPVYGNHDAVYTDSKYDASSGKYMVCTDGIAAKNMADTLYFVGYAKLNTGKYVYSKVYEHGPKKYCMNLLSKSSTAEEMKDLCVALMNYGAAAQLQFNYNTDSLMNAELTDEQKARVMAYDSSLFTGVVPASSTKTANFTKTTTGFSTKTASVSFDSAFAINYYFTPNQTVNGNITFYYWTHEDYAAAQTLTTQNASGSIVMTYANGPYWAQVSGIAAKYMDETVYTVGVYQDNDGNTYCSGVVPYSLSKFCMNKVNSDSGDLAQAMAMYGYYTKTYFTSIGSY